MKSVSKKHLLALMFCLQTNHNLFIVFEESIEDKIRMSTKGEFEDVLLAIFNRDKLFGANNIDPNDAKRDAHVSRCNQKCKQVSMSMVANMTGSYEKGAGF